MRESSKFRQGGGGIEGVRVCVGEGVSDNVFSSINVYNRGPYGPHRSNWTYRGDP